MVSKNYFLAPFLRKLFEDMLHQHQSINQKGRRQRIQETGDSIRKEEKGICRMIRGDSWVTAAKLGSNQFSPEEEVEGL